MTGSATRPLRTWGEGSEEGGTTETGGGDDVVDGDLEADWDCERDGDRASSSSSIVDAKIWALPRQRGRLATARDGKRARERERIEREGSEEAAAAGREEEGFLLERDSSADRRHAFD